MASYYDLGSFSREITTTSPMAQKWFDLGLNWCYAYNHEECIVCFTEALQHDPNCAMAHWGIAYAKGPNYNKPWDAFDDEDKRESLQSALAAVEAAVRLCGLCTAPEQALIGALAQRYPQSPEEADFGPWHTAYATAMRAVYTAYPRDLDVCALFAEALMNRTPWQLWDLATGKPAEGADTTEAIEVLETALGHEVCNPANGASR